MYAETVSDALRRALRALSSLACLKHCYLAGGTALALQLGHRVSRDLDFFFPETANENAFLDEIQRAGLHALVVSHTPSHLELVVERIKVDFIRERIGLQLPLVSGQLEDIAFQMADPRDIGRLKLLSIASRGSKKDFVDLYCLTRKELSLESLILLAVDYGSTVRYSRLLFLKGLVDFDEADRDPELPMLWNVRWPEVKETLRREVKEIALRICR